MFIFTHKFSHLKKKEKKSPVTKLMYTNELFQSLGMKNELFKVQGRKPNFIQSLGTKTII